MILVTRSYAFAAAHVLAHPSLSDAENDRIYGKCSNPNGHGHDYEVELTVEGPIDPATGRVIDPTALDAIFDEQVGRRFGHAMLNDDPAFLDLVPTAENIAVVIHERMRGPIAEQGGARLVRVRVGETRRNSFAYGEMQ